MNLFDQVSADISEAMKAQEPVRLQTLRGIKKDFIEAKTAKGSDGELSDEKAIAILQRMLKQRRESANIYAAANRPDLANNELAEAAVIETYLPQPLTADELKASIAGIIGDIDAQGLKDMGKVMSVANRLLIGKAPGRMISDTVKEMLQAQ
jgi:uncharacterized protein YqeY